MPQYTRSLLTLKKEQTRINSTLFFVDVILKQKRKRLINHQPDNMGLYELYDAHKDYFESNLSSESFEHLIKGKELLKLFMDAIQDDNPNASEDAVFTYVYEKCMELSNQLHAIDDCLNNDRHQQIHEEISKIDTHFPLIFAGGISHTLRQALNQDLA